jgi:phosphoribosylanthranilate isomerase
VKQKGFQQRLVVKICGITTPDDAALAASAGADAIGLNFWHGSKRVVSVAQARRIIGAVPPFVWVVGVFVNAKVAEVQAIARAVGLHGVQLHGDESPREASRIGLFTIKALRVKDASVDAEVRRYGKVDALLLDAAQSGYGGGGMTFDWRLARRIAKERPILLAGGLDPTNVGRAVKEVRPLGVDVASGVERAPGIKDERKVRAFIRAARTAQGDR